MAWDWLLYLASGSVLTVTALGFLMNWLFRIQASKILREHDNKLALQFFEHQTRYSILHEERAKVIGKLFGKIERLASMLTMFTHFFQTTSNDKHKKDFSDLFLETMNFFNEHSIYLDDSTCRMIPEIFNVFDVIFSKVRNFQGEWRDIVSTENWVEANSKFNEKWPPLKAKLRSEMRAILDGEKPARS